ncbi:hypothetical protein M426DRAFT_262474 [Hypoxylon sp. CI-4A]|nr:hypothetical protein M426DRAFT_262474 [Hypoxylon sp. CI-4A]
MTKRPLGSSSYYEQTGTRYYNNLAGAILQPLISLLVSFESVAVTTCLDIPVGYCSKFGPTTIGYDPEPADMPRLQRNLVLHDVLGRLVTVSDLEPQPNLWPVKPDSNQFIDGYLKPLHRQMFSSYFGYNPEGFFVTALSNGTNTGV